MYKTMGRKCIELGKQTQGEIVHGIMFAAVLHVFCPSYHILNWIKTPFTTIRCQVLPWFIDGPITTSHQSYFQISGNQNVSGVF